MGGHSQPLQVRESTDGVRDRACRVGVAERTIPRSLTMHSEWTVGRSSLSPLFPPSRSSAVNVPHPLGARAGQVVVVKKPAEWGVDGRGGQGGAPQHNQGHPQARQRNVVRWGCAWDRGKSDRRIRSYWCCGVVEWALGGGQHNDDCKCNGEGNNAKPSAPRALHVI